MVGVPHTLPATHSAATRPMSIHVGASPSERVRNPLDAYRLPAVLCYLLSMCSVLILRVWAPTEHISIEVVFWVDITDGISILIGGLIFLAVSREVRRVSTDTVCDA
eukprot:g13017.t1